MHDIDPKLVETFAGGALMFGVYLFLKLVFGFIEKMRAKPNSINDAHKSNELNESIKSISNDIKHLDEVIEKSLLTKNEQLMGLIEKTDERVIKLAETNILMLELIKSLVGTFLQFSRRN